MKCFNTTKTDRLLIRVLDMKDKETFFHYRSLPEISQYQSWRPKSVAEAEEFILKNGEMPGDMTDRWLQLAVCLDTGQMIGDIGIHYIDQYQLEIGYTLAPAHQGKGYACEAVKAIVNAAFSELKIHRITASVDPRNSPSIKLLERIGFRKEAHFIKSFRMDGAWYDDCVYALLEEEWHGLKS